MSADQPHAVSEVEFLRRCADVVGAAQVLTGEDARPFLSDWHGRFRGAARAVLRPDSTRQVAEIVKLCAAANVAIVPQGGNTGLCGGATPSADGGCVVLQLGRMQRLRAIDVENGTMTVEAGMVLATAQAHADAHGLLLPLSLAAEGSCTIGGNLATNAGGTGVLRYGNARELALGLEVVTPDGEIWDGLRGLRKDNAGYDLKDLYIGSEGTLGIITAAVLKLFPAPQAHGTAFLALPSMAAGIAALRAAQGRFGAELTAFEILSSSAFELVRAHAGLGPAPTSASPWYALVELSHGHASPRHEEALQELLGELFEREVVQDAAIAASLDQARTLWAWRESVSESQSAHGGVLKHDISLPISALAAFCERVTSDIESRWPELQVIAFGHAGDGNLHYNVAARDGAASGELPVRRDEIAMLVHDEVMAMGGSFSAEHGIGQAKVLELARRKGAVELSLMRRLKSALDPANRLNPGKVLPAVSKDDGALLRYT